MTTPTAPTLHSIHEVSHRLWDERPDLREEVDRQVWKTANEYGGPQDFVSASEAEPVVGFNRLHADLKRLAIGKDPVDPVSRAALEKALDALDAMGFVADATTTTVSSKELRIIGCPDLVGKTMGTIPTVVELKVVDKIPRVPRAVDVIQVLLYAIAGFTLKEVAAGEIGMVIVYLQDAPGFPTRAERVLNAHALFPVVRQLTA